MSLKHMDLSTFSKEEIEAFQEHQVARETDIDNALIQHNQLHTKLKRSRIKFTHGELYRAKMDDFEKASCLLKEFEQ